MITLSAILPSWKDPLLIKTIDSLLANSELGDQLEVIAGGYIYLITNKVNGKQYVGQTISSVSQRWSQHVYNSKRGENYPLYNAINKYGKNNFDMSVLAKATSIQALNILEKFFIKEMKTLVPFGYNLRNGGDNSRLHESTKKKLSIIHAGRPGIRHTEEFKKKLSERSLGNKFTLGRKQSKKEKEKRRIISATYKRGGDGKFVRKYE